MLAAIQGPLGIAVMRLVRAGNIDGIDLFQECVKLRVERSNPPFFCEAFGTLAMRIIDAGSFHPADEMNFAHETVGYPSRSDNPNPDEGMPRATEEGRTDVLRPRQIDDFTEILQIVELTHPVRSDGKDINPVFLDILYFLAKMIFNDNLICKTGFLDILYAFRKGIDYVQLSPRLIVLLCRDTDDKVITQCLCIFQNIIMSLMEQIEGTVCNNLFHVFLPIRNITAIHAKHTASFYPIL